MGGPNDVLFHVGDEKEIFARMMWKILISVVHQRQLQNSPSAVKKILMNWKWVKCVYGQKGKVVCYINVS